MCAYAPVGAVAGGRHIDTVPPCRWFLHDLIEQNSQQPFLCAHSSRTLSVILMQPFMLALIRLCSCQPSLVALTSALTRRDISSITFRDIISYRGYYTSLLAFRILSKRLQWLLTVCENDPPPSSLPCILQDCGGTRKNTVSLKTSLHNFETTWAVILTLVLTSTLVVATLAAKYIFFPTPRVAPVSQI